MLKVEFSEIVEEMAGKYSKLLSSQELMDEFKELTDNMGKAMTIKEFRPMFRKKLSERFGF